VAAASQYLFLRELGLGRSPELARTLAVNTLVAGQVFYLFNARYLLAPSLGARQLLSNRAALVAVAVLLVFQAVFTYLPLFQTWFGTAGLRPAHWLWVLGAGVAVFALVEIEKTVVRRRRGRNPG
jgi:magnesium-transporting ATPase (P-type)